MWGNSLSKPIKSAASAFQTEQEFCKELCACLTPPVDCPFLVAPAIQQILAHKVWLCDRFQLQSKKSYFVLTLCASFITPGRRHELGKHSDGLSPQGGASLPAQLVTATYEANARGVALSHCRSSATKRPLAQTLICKTHRRKQVAEGFKCRVPGQFVRFLRLVCNSCSC